MAEENNSGLTASEQAYFESGGETEVVETAAPAPTTEAPAQEVEQAVTEQPAPSQERDEKGRFVPHQALHAEREEHKKTKAELEQIKQQQAILNDRWNTLLAARQQPEQQTEETPPDPETDIIGYMKWQAQQNQKLQEKITNSEKQREQQQQAEQQERVIWDTWSNSVAQAKTSKPDFDKATEYLSSLRDKQLSAFAAANPAFANPQMRVQQINAELRGIIIEAKQQGRDPAEVVYEIAQGFGYAPASAPDPQQETIDRIARIDEAQRASKTLNQSNGTNSGDPLSAEAIASMPPREFEAWIKDPANEKRFNALMGG
ncbi:hypothetical protein CN878_16735 [Ochrobactrum sp. 695/2009]|nr:hypothetical protein CN881_19550 [Ochrobactrum sp. 721/2009]PJT16734.1 hypothetical protein CN880_10415 [Ochrobactrum sp. 720/2009]PJT26556.1 hypothetical protein CN879_06380 [Ochrobactrum sp. 715/2009]PJT28628.1 hypothetical protein CN878_16735 [Ochrobactrum sp. 695/2009]PJT36076.1 hypothetical protein CN877_08825 [Ochrobactrum sp. 689/2009]